MIYRRIIPLIIRPPRMRSSEFSRGTWRYWLITGSAMNAVVDISITFVAALFYDTIMVGIMKVNQCQNILNIRSPLLMLLMP